MAGWLVSSFNQSIIQFIDSTNKYKTQWKRQYKYRVETGIIITIKIVQKVQTQEWQDS